ncbi:hypothetical protein C8R43DRAFT_1108705, partial [Mycena crocata]
MYHRPASMVICSIRLFFSFSIKAARGERPRPPHLQSTVFNCRFRSSQDIEDTTYRVPARGLPGKTRRRQTPHSACDNLCPNICPTRNGQD